jgi:hypothetical protein
MAPESLLALPSVTTGLTSNDAAKQPWITEPHEKICKRTDTAVAFTSEYSKSYRIQENVSMISMAQAHPRTQHR